MTIEQKDDKNYARFEGRVRNARVSVLPEHKKPGTSEWCSGRNQYPQAVYSIEPQARQLNGTVIGTCSGCNGEFEYMTYGWTMKKPKKD